MFTLSKPKDTSSVANFCATEKAWNWPIISLCTRKAGIRKPAWWSKRKIWILHSSQIFPLKSRTQWKLWMQRYQDRGRKLLIWRDKKKKLASHWKTQWKQRRPTTSNSKRTSTQYRNKLSLLMKWWNLLTRTSITSLKHKINHQLHRLRLHRERVPFLRNLIQSSNKEIVSSLKVLRMMKN